MEQFDRREFLARAGGVAVTAGTIGVGPAFAGWSSSGGQPLRELARTLDGTVVARADAAYAHARLLVSTRFDAVHPQEGRKVVAAIRIENDARFGRRNFTRRQAALMASHDPAHVIASTSPVARRNWLMRLPSGCQ